MKKIKFYKLYIFSGRASTGLRRASKFQVLLALPGLSSFLVIISPWMCSQEVLVGICDIPVVEVWHIPPVPLSGFGISDNEKEEMVFWRSWEDFDSWACRDDARICTHRHLGNLSGWGLVVFFPNTPIFYSMNDWLYSHDLEGKKVKQYHSPNIISSQWVVR